MCACMCVHPRVGLLCLLLCARSMHTVVSELGLGLHREKRARSLSSLPLVVCQMTEVPERLSTQWVKGVHLRKHIWAMSKKESEAEHHAPASAPSARVQGHPAGLPEPRLPGHEVPGKGIPGHRVFWCRTLNYLALGLLGLGHLGSELSKPQTYWHRYLSIRSIWAPELPEPEPPGYMAVRPGPPGFRNTLGRTIGAQGYLGTKHWARHIWAQRYLGWGHLGKGSPGCRSHGYGVT